MVYHVALLREFAGAVLSLADQEGVQPSCSRVFNSLFEIQLSLKLFRFHTIKRI